MRVTFKVNLLEVGRVTAYCLILLLLASCGLSVEERMKLTANGELAPYVLYDVEKAQGKRLETATVELAYDPATDALSGPFWTHKVSPGCADFVTEMEGGGPDEIRVWFAEPTMWDTEQHGFWVTKAEDVRITDKGGKKVISLRLVPVDSVENQDFDNARRNAIYTGM